MIGINNDHKENYQSYSCSIINDDYTKNYEIMYENPDFYNITGYGATKSEAIADFKDKLEKLIEIHIDYTRNIIRKILLKDIVDADFIATDYNMISQRDKVGNRIHITQFDKDNDV